MFGLNYLLVVFSIHVSGMLIMYPFNVTFKMSGYKDKIDYKKFHSQSILAYDQYENDGNKAFGDYVFGMDRITAEKINAKSQTLGKFVYQLTPRYNGSDRLYAVLISSQNEKTVQYDNRLKEIYRNLYLIVETRYGKPAVKRSYPSVFDVQDSGIFISDKWEVANKCIHLGIKQNSLNEYAVYCRIFDKQMDELETKRIQNVKNKDIIDASKKF